MNQATRLVGALALLLLLAFCGFGFLATFEPLDVSTQLTWRLVYGLMGITCLSGFVLLLRPRKHRP